MAVITPAIGTPGATAKAHRQAFSALVGQDVETFVNSATAVGPGHGLVRAGHLAVSEKASTANMSVDVAKGTAFVTGDSSLAQGVYVATNDAVTNLAIAAADATNDRHDLVVFQVRDNAEDSSGSTDARLTVVTGTPAGSPADPTIPDGCLVLARVVVQATVTSIVDADITNLAGVAHGSDWNSAWGTVGYAATNTAQSGITSTSDLTSLTVTWTAVTGRLYRLSYTTRFDTAAATVVRLRCTDSSNVNKNAADVEIDAGGAQFGTVTSFHLETGLSGSVTRKLRLESTSGASVTAHGSNNYGTLLVEDIGPAV